MEPNYLYLEFNEEESLFRAHERSNPYGIGKGEGWVTIGIAPYGDWAAKFTDYMRTKKGKITRRTAVYEFVNWAKNNL